ncbi:MAG: exosortase-dependent surface protein XDP2 [Polyangiales bacterium]
MTLARRLCFVLLAASGCAVETSDPSELEGQQAELELRERLPWQPSQLTPFAFESETTSSDVEQGDVRLDAVTFDGRSWSRHLLAPVVQANIVKDDGVDVERGGNNFASGQGIASADDTLTREGPATITPTGRDLAASLGNYNLTSIVVTRENEGTASLEVTFAWPVNTLLFWERGNASSPTTANSDLLVETLDWLGRVTASHKLLRSEYAPTGIEITTWNGSFSSPSQPGGAPPELGAVGLKLDGVTQRLRLTSVQGPEGGLRDDGPDYKVLGALIPGR